MATDDFVNAKRLDLTRPDAGPIEKLITNIGMLYATDFKETVTAPTAIVTLTVQFLMWLPLQSVSLCDH